MNEIIEITVLIGIGITLIVSVFGDDSPRRFLTLLTCLQGGLCLVYAAQELWFYSVFHLVASLFFFYLIYRNSKKETQIQQQRIKRFEEKYLED